MQAVQPVRVRLGQVEILKNCPENPLKYKAMSKDQENQNKKSELTDKSKSDKSDISNSLEKDVVSDKMPADKTPQGRTDNEEDRELKKKE